jgi:hypothetical protein
MKIFDDDILLKYDVHIDKNFNIDGSISYNLKGNKEEVEEIIDLLIRRTKADYQINQVKHGNKNNMNYNIIFKNKTEIKPDITDLIFNNIFGNTNELI